MGFLETTSVRNLLVQGGRRVIHKEIETMTSLGSLTTNLHNLSPNLMASLQWGLKGQIAKASRCCKYQWGKIRPSLKIVRLYLNSRCMDIQRRTRRTMQSTSSVTGYYSKSNLKSKRSLLGLTVISFRKSCSLWLQPWMTLEETTMKNSTFCLDVVKRKFN